MAVVIETTLGDITVDLFIEERPRACLNFIKLCKLKYYNFNLFHTIERDFIAQTGDPSGVGDGGESIWGVVEGAHKRFFEAESLPKIKHTVPGLLSLVSVGKFMVGSQFFFTLGADLTSLDAVHCVIGEVVEGREILRKLNEAIVDEKFRPFQDIRVTHTVILDDPFSDPRGFQVPSRSPSPSADRLQNGRIGADEDIDDTEGKTMEEIQEMLAEREAKARATILEIVGDLPDADIAPPENVLFVCKLNPVTTDDDLEIIFSRFGKVKGCEVIRDKVSGDSLQYAFVEFEEQKSCEAAYFKMDNVLIDDRRIHVDFSQSVSKVQWRGKGRGLVHADEKDRKLDFNNLKGNRGGERRGAPEQRRQRDRSRSPIRRSDNEPRGRRDERNNGSRRSPNGRRSPESRKRLGQRGTRRQRSVSRDRSPTRRKASPQRRLPPRERSPVRRRESPSKRSPPRERSQIRRKASPPRRSPPREKRASSHEKPRSSQQGKQQSASSDRHRSNRRSPYERKQSSPNRRRRSPANEKARSPVVSSIKNSHPKHLIERNSESKREGRDRSQVKLDKPSGVDHTSNIYSKKKQTKSIKKREKTKKKKKPITSSSSSSETESDSSSTSSSSSSSSSSDDDKRKKSKKSKKSRQKTKKHSKKKIKKHSSSSSD